MNSPALWRMASVSPVIFGIPCLAYCPLFICLLHMKIWTLICSVTIIAFSGVLAKYGYTYTVFIRKIASVLRGKQISSNPWWFIERFRGY
jgi:intracellular multiplication protein IcmT